ncbi:arginine decarboxylase-like [Forsythia ovata]|uniref:Arginine decarboxylase n=1 Tax=Forsythia ovata TaxID=205694 RepID=A0ABD1UB82_9LAMI
MFRLTLNGALILQKIDMGMQLVVAAQAFRSYRKRYAGPGLLRRRFCSPSFGYAFARESALRCRWCLSEVFSSLGAPPSTNTAAATAFITVHVTWSPAQSAALYRVYGWRALYFSVNSSGNISSRPHGVGTLAHQEINLFKVVKKVSEPKSFGGRGLQLSLIVRFPKN